MSLRRHLTYANVISTLCLFLVLGGGAAVAATKLGRSSVGTEQLKGEAVTKGKMAPDSVNSKKVVNGSLTGEDIVSSSLGKVPTAADAEHANWATTAGSADSASTATHADTASNAEKLDGHSADEFGSVVIATPTVPPTIEGEIYFAASADFGFDKTSSISVSSLFPGHHFRANDFAVHFISETSVAAEIHVSLVVNGAAQEVCSVATVPSTCTPSSTSIEIPAGAQVAWKLASSTPVQARPQFAMRLVPN